MKNQSTYALNLIAASTLLTGLLTLSSTLFAVVHLHHITLAIADTHLTVIAGLSLIYLATMLRRAKHNAWLISLGVYGYLIIRNFQHFVINFRNGDRVILAVLNLAIPLATMFALVVFKHIYNVRSEPRSFTIALRRALLILLIAFLYGVIGFQLFDEKDYHTEMSLPTSAHYTVDQFGFTTSDKPTAYTRRARFFIDSLAAVSLTSLVYVAVSFFAPIRFRLSHHEQEYEHAKAIIRKHSLTSEDFFKLWPRDKAYFFDSSYKSVLAYRVVGGLALVVGDPAGPPETIRSLLESFIEYCRLNDWSVAFVHTGPNNLNLYRQLGFDVQKIGEEALVNVSHFNKTVAANKYFRHIKNKFEKQKYTCQILAPPHSQEAISGMKAISADWLKQPGRAERGFMMGYFSETYMQTCEVVALCDEHGHMQAFLNQVPAYKPGEANYDFLRQAAAAQSNASDYLMTVFMNHLEKNGFKTVNMGLAPLKGLEPSKDKDKDRSAIDSLLHLVYTNAGRFYSFQGLARFKSKYEPDWEDRYIIYRGGIPGFTKTMNLLLRAMTHY